MPAEPVAGEAATPKLGGSTGHFEETLDVRCCQGSPDLTEVHARTATAALLLCFGFGGSGALRRRLVERLTNRQASIRGVDAECTKLGGHRTCVPSDHF